MRAVVLLQLATNSDIAVSLCKFESVALVVEQTLLQALFISAYKVVRLSFKP
jgi:hypothetical protein